MLIKEGVFLVGTVRTQRHSEGAGKQLVLGSRRKREYGMGAVTWTGQFGTSVGLGAHTVTSCSAFRLHLIMCLRVRVRADVRGGGEGRGGGGRGGGRECEDVGLYTGSEEAEEEEEGV